MDELLAREARRSGLRRGRGATLAAVERRRVELFSLTVVVLGAAVALVVLVSVSPRLPGVLGSAARGALRVSLGLLAAAFIAYVIDQELHLRRLQALLLEERVLSNAYARRVEELSALGAAAQTVSASLEPDDVLRVVLEEALALFEADEGAVMMPEGPEGAASHLRVERAQGTRRMPGDRLSITGGDVGAVAQQRVAVLPVCEPGHSTMLAPLVHRHRLLGVLELSSARRRFDAYDLELMALFAGYASASIANAALYDCARRQVAELKELDHLKSEFVSNVSHELRTPLTSIIGCVSLLRRDHVPEEARHEFHDAIERQAKRLAAMVDQLLQAGRLEHGPEAAPAEPVDLAALARGVAVDLELSGRPVELVAPPTCMVSGDPGALQQVLWNLLENAHKYGRPPVRLEVHDGLGTVRVSVSDAGDGIPPEDRERVFERFSRLDPAGEQLGIGLGLAIVRQLVHAAGGRVWADDAPGGGAVFTVVLPALAPPPGRRSDRALERGTAP